MRSKQIIATTLFAMFFPITIATAQAPQTTPNQSLAAPPSPASPCGDTSYHTLDFWVGHWEVFDSSDGSKAGTSILEKVLQGCAIEVNWTGVEGDHVKELFYFNRPKQKWIQVWVGDTGASKQRQLVEVLKDGSVLFQGEVDQMDGGSHLDRSTVTPLPGNKVHQVIEFSKDKGKTWQVGFDAEYRRQ